MASLIDKLNDEVNQILVENHDLKKGEYPYKADYRPKIKRILDDIDENHNNSWSVEFFRKARSGNLDCNAVFYRGTYISYRELYEKAYEFAKSLKAMGYKKGDEIPVCVGNIPEFLYIELAINLIGCKMNSFGDWFDPEYTKFILNNSKSKTVFISDDVRDMLKDKIEGSNVENVVVFSLADSLKKDANGKVIDPYAKYDSKVYDMRNYVGDIKSTWSKNIINKEEFMSLGLNYNDRVVENMSLDDHCAITYTSGTTHPGWPKAVLNDNRTYYTMSRFKDADISGMASLNKRKVMHHIPTYTHMELCSICDSLYQICSLRLEPFYREDFFKYAILINEPNYSPGSVAFWSSLCDALNNGDPEFKDADFGHLIAAVVTGEGMSQGEEKYFNYTARKHKFGSKELPFPIAPISFSIGGGTNEASGIFTTLFKAHMEKLPQNLKHRKEGLGLTTLPFAITEVLDDEGHYCKIGEAGTLVSRSPAMMVGYYYDEELNKDAFITDAYGNRWVNMGKFSYKSDKYGRIKMKGRPKAIIKLDDGKTVPFFNVEDTVLKDTKLVMSCSVVPVNDDCLGEVYAIWVVPNPRINISKEKFVRSIVLRLEQQFDKEVLDKLYINVTHKFPVAPSGKRDLETLKTWGYDKEANVTRLATEYKYQMQKDSKVFKMGPM